MTHADEELLRVVTCPHCWAPFPPHDVLWISAHEDLRGDQRLGADHQQRFLPTRFTVDGNAVDAREFVCQRLACPKCHLEIPRTLLETEPFYVSILGTPASGKSFFLSALSWELRRLLPKGFRVGFSDADTGANQSLTEYEEAMFLNQAPDRLVPLANLIRKTEEQGGKLYDSVMYGNQSISYPRPFLFYLKPLPEHPLHAYSRQLRRLVCLYDNAGESFQVGKDSTSNPVTRHMTVARVLLFLFDPLQDARFQKFAKQTMPQQFANLPTRTSRQELILQEAATRVRRALSLPATARHQCLLIVLVTKCDTWLSSLSSGLPQSPWLTDGGAHRLDTACIEHWSKNKK